MPDLGAMASQVATQFGIPPDIFSALINKESGGNPSIIGGAGEVGLTQIKPSTAGLTQQQLLDPLTNLQAGAGYLAQQYKAFGNWTDALRGYNAGTTGAMNNPTLSAGYASSILGAAGVTGASAPGTQPAGATGTNSSTGTPTSAQPAPAATGSALGTGVKYGLFILVIVLLVIFGIYGTIKS